MSKENNIHKDCPHCGGNNYKSNGFFSTNYTCLECGETVNIKEIDKPLKEIVGTGSQEDADEEEQVEGRVSDHDCPVTDVRHKWHIKAAGTGRGGFAPVYIQCEDCGSMERIAFEKFADYPGWPIEENTPTDSDESELGEE